MRFSLTKVLLLIVVVILSVSIGNISTIIRVHFKTNSNVGKANELEDTSRENCSSTSKHQISNSHDDLMWFLQISDLHISIFQDTDRIKDLEEFCKETVDAIRPAVVLASGDLTDAKSVDTLGSRQFEDEWKLYQETLEKSQVEKKTVWLDVRGNHDTFNVPGLLSSENYFRNYSQRGKNHPRSYLHTVRIPCGKVFSFIALDACLEPGPKRPFNFFGLVNQAEHERLKKVMQRSAELGSSHNIWFGHYPTSCILSAGQGVRSLISSDSKAQAYLCGHFHAMGGLITNMYTLQHDGFLELELADWKINRMYRLAAIDHGLFSFIDIPYKQWPIILITNPKNALYQIPDREPMKAVATSSHIRVLTFSTSEILSVKVKIDNEGWSSCTHVKGPLYVNSWTPELYSNGLHNITVQVLDKLQRTNTQSQLFSLDGTHPDFDIMPRILLMTNISILCQVLFGLSILGCVVPLSLLRLMMASTHAGHKYVPTSSISFIRHWYRRFWILANLDKFYYPLILYPLYTTLGPWAVGEIIEGYIGVIFAWGIFVNGAYLPGSFTYAYGFFQMVTFQFPLTLVLAYKLNKRLEPPPLASPGLLQRWLSDLPLYLILAIQLLFLFFFWLSYGSLAVILGPFRSWPVFNTLYLWRQVKRTPLVYIQELADIFEAPSSGSPVLKSSKFRI